MGSPPRGRGKGVSNVLVPEKFGITPAWAGKSASPGFSGFLPGDHPRVGGEKFVDESHFYKNLGSPPRGRGKVAGAACRDLLGGITPAWAGKRRCTAACNRLCWDHPRVGGEKIDSLPHRALYLGSPPRGRGKDLVRFYPLCFPGITPAWAGKSRRTVFAVFHPEDHPRVGGEKLFCRFLHRFDRGSPPRGRGKVGEQKSTFWGKGITPAWAGKSAGPRPHLAKS